MDYAVVTSIGSSVLNESVGGVNEAIALINEAIVNSTGLWVFSKGDAFLVIPESMLTSSELGGMHASAIGAIRIVAGDCDSLVAESCDVEEVFGASSG